MATSYLLLETGSTDKLMLESGEAGFLVLDETVTGSERTWPSDSRASIPSGYPYYPNAKWIELSTIRRKP